jgi:hypothetical protein
MMAALERMLILSSALFLFSSRAHTQETPLDKRWRFLSASVNDDDSAYLDMTTITRTGTHNRSAWVRINYVDAQDLDRMGAQVFGETHVYTYSVANFEVNCTSRRWRSPAVFFYFRDDRLVGKANDPSDAPFNLPPPGSLAEIVVNEVCSRTLKATR